MKTVFYRTETKKVDALKTDGAFMLGCAVHDGVIEPALNFGTGRGWNVPQTVKVAACVDEIGKFMIFDDEHGVHISTDGVNYSKMDTFEADDAFFAQERNGDEAFAYLICADKVLIRAADYFSGAGKPVPVKCGVMRYGRLFGADRTDELLLRWSGEDGVQDWKESISGAGWAYMSADLGKILDVVDLNEKLVVVREHGITVLNALGVPENFKFSGEYRTPAISPNTAKVLNGKVIFSTDDGFYRFDGNKAEKLDCPNYDGMQNVTQSAVAGGRYYAALGYCKQLEKTAIFIYDARFSCGYFIDFAPQYLLGGNGKFFGYLNAATHVSEKTSSFKYVSGEMDFGTSDRKVLKRVKVRGSVDKITVICDGKERVFLSPKCELPTHICGRSFKIAVEGASKIEGIEAYAEVKSGN